jgi:hypothetical protein
VSDNRDWVHSDHSDEDEGEAQKLGVGRIGEYPPRIQWLRKRHLRLMTLRMAVKCVQHDGKMTALARPQSRDSPRSGKRSGARFWACIQREDETNACKILQVAPRHRRRRRHTTAVQTGRNVGDVVSLPFSESKA